MPPRPAVTWGRLLGWTRDNEVPDDAIVQDDDGRRATDAYLASPGPRLFVVTRRDPGEFMTVAQLRALGESLGAEARDEVWLDGQGFTVDAAKVVDLSGEGAAGPADDGNHYLTLQRRWG